MRGGLPDTEVFHMSIHWRGNLDDAYQEAQDQGKLVMIDLFNPG